MWADLSFDVRSFSPDSFGPSWGLTWEAAQELLEYHGGGGRHRAARGKDDQAYRDHWDYMDRLREIQALAKVVPLDNPPVGQGDPQAVDLSPSLAVKVPGRVMRGTVETPKSQVLAQFMGSPLMLVALGFVIKECDD